MMLLLLARHGNTFNKGDKVVWVGARTDLPLTAKGREQALALGQALAPFAPRIKRVISGPLLRTREHAAIAAQVLGSDPRVEVDERLREIDYGLWEAKSTGEIQAFDGADELKAWDKSGIWPTSPGWSPPQDTIAMNATQLAQNLATSLHRNDAGAARHQQWHPEKFFLKLVPGAFEDMAARGFLKVSTGTWALACETGTWRVVFWNRQPDCFAFD